MSESEDGFTMDDTELTVLALEIMEDFQNLSIKPNIDPTDSYMFKLDTNDDIDDEITPYIPSTDDDDEEDMVYIAYPTEAMTIMSLSSSDSLNNILPPIPPCNSPITQHTKTQTMTTINIAGNKKRGIKRWSQRHKKRSYSPSPSVPTVTLQQNNESEDTKKYKKALTMKQLNCTKKKKNIHKQRKYRSDELIKISSNDSIFGMDNIDINIPKEPSPYFIKRVNSPFDKAMDDSPFSPVFSPMNTKDYDDNKNPFRRSGIENKARKTKKKKRKKRKEGTTKKNGTARSIVTGSKRDKMKKCKAKKRPITPVSDSRAYSIASPRYHIEAK